MMRPFVALSIGILMLCACSHKADVQCICHGANGAQQVYDLGIQKNPNTKDDIVKCDTLAAHDGLDSCTIVTFGH